MIARPSATYMAGEVERLGRWGVVVVVMVGGGVKRYRSPFVDV